jgi:hypothetical protein
VNTVEEGIILLILNTMNLKMTSVKVVSDGECTDPKVAA